MSLELKLIQQVGLGVGEGRDYNSSELRSGRLLVARAKFESVGLQGGEFVVRDNGEIIADINRMPKWQSSPSKSWVAQVRAYAGCNETFDRESCEFKVLEVFRENSRSVKSRMLSPGEAYREIQVRFQALFSQA